MPSSACDWSSDVCSSDRSEEHTSELQSRSDLVCRLLLEKKKNTSELQSRSDLVCRLLLEKKKTKFTTTYDTSASPTPVAQTNHQLGRRQPTATHSMTII